MTVLASPNWLHPAWGMDALTLVFLPLVVPDTAGRLQGRLAERWEHTPDYREWRVYLRRDVQYVVAHRRIRGLRNPVPGDPLGYLNRLWIEQVN